MATVFPQDWLHSPYLHDGEKSTVGWLAQTLPDDYTVWAGVEWASRAQNGAPVYGEIDFIVVGPSGDLVMIEQKNGAVYVDDAGELRKSYGNKEKAVGRQLRQSFSAFLKHWEAAWGLRADKPYVNSLIYLPDHTVERIASLQLDRIQLVDARHARNLPDIVMQLLADRPVDDARRARTLEFLEGQLSLAFDVGAALDNQDKVYRTHGNRLAAFVAALEFSPWRLHVQGAAGSGKTQLAAQRYAQALRAGRKPLYTCFNRPLAERLCGMLPAGGRVANVDHLTELYFDADGPEHDRTDLGARLEALRAQALAAPPPDGWRFDPVIVDEGQDFSAQQIAFVEHLLAPGGELLWMEDARQCIQRREEVVPPPATVRLNLRENYRCGRAIVDYTNTLLKLEPPDIAAGAIQGELPELVVLREGDDVAAVVARAVRRLIDEGYAPQDIAVISDQGRTRSQLVQREHIGNWPTRRFLGEFVDGRQAYSGGELRLDTVYRFKGLQAAAVVYAEIDFEAITPQVINRLYTGMTRARSALVLVVTERAAQLLAARLGGG